VYVAFFQKTAFDQGLPMRGAVDWGNFFVSEYRFAGKPIIDAYRMSGRLEFSGCVFCKNAAEEFERLKKVTDKEKFETIDMVVFSYPAFLSDGEERLWLIDLLFSDYAGKGKDISDVREYIVDRFYAHNKDIVRRVIPKIENTEMVLRYCLKR